MNGQTKNLLLSLIFLIGAPAYGMKPSAVATATKAQPKQDYFFATIKAIKDGNAQRVMNNVEQDPGLITRKDDTGTTLLGHAALRGDIKLVKFLTDKGSDIDAADNKSNTPLAKAISSTIRTEGHKETIDYLSKKGAIVYAKITLMLEPSFAYRFNAWTLYSRDKYKLLPPEIRQKTDLVQQDDLHISLVYVAVPIYYDPQEGNDYEDQAKTLLDQTRDSVKPIELRNTLFPLGNRFQTRALQILGGFVTVVYDVPSEFLRIIDGVYARLLKAIPGAREAYAQRLRDVHVSLAQLKRGETFGTTVIPQTNLHKFDYQGFLVGDKPEDSEIKIGVRIPSRTAPNKFIECSGNPVACERK